MADVELRRFVRAPELLDILGVSLASLYTWMADGSFPRAAKFGRAAAWDRDEVAEWQRQRIAARDEPAAPRDNGDELLAHLKSLVGPDHPLRTSELIALARSDPALAALLEKHGGANPLSIGKWLMSLTRRDASRGVRLIAHVDGYGKSFAVTEEGHHG